VALRRGDGHTAVAFSFFEVTDRGVRLPAFAERVGETRRRPGGRSLRRHLAEETTMTGRVIAMTACAIGWSLAAAAQDRMPPIPASQQTDAQKKAIAEFTAARKADISGPFVPLLRSPEVMNRARAMGDYLRFNSVLPPRLSEFAILITARRWTQNYEWDAHSALALKGGLSADIVQAIAEGRRPERMAADEDALYTLCDELHRNQSVSDPTYTRAVATFGEQGVIDILGISGYYTMLAMVLNTARTPLPAGHAPALSPFPR
jgi:4-carboxymuconolactone decarboxylase